jgi:S-adenosylmethionine-diacylglycerol 3-amino-3-carboxypropyl transferase
MQRLQNSTASEISFSQVPEDPRIELSVAEALGECQENLLRVLVVASGGCTALSLLASPMVGRIDAVDSNPAQLHLVELRRQALLHLPLFDQMALIGGDRQTSDRERLDLYKELRPYLPVATVSFWDAHLDQIARGVNQVGRFETLIAQLSARLSTLGIDPLEDWTESLEHSAWTDELESIFTPEELVNLFGERAVKNWKNPSFAEHFGQRLAVTLQKMSPKENYFMTQLFANTYAEGLKGVPVYLQGPAQGTIQALGTHRLQLHCGEFLEKIVELGESGGFDLISMSNFGEGMPPRQLQQAIATVSQQLNPGGALIGRRLHHHDDLGTLMAQHLRVDRDLSAQLLETERSYLYQEVVVGFAE